MSKHLRMQHSSVTESTDARWRRLRPDLYWETEAEAVLTPHQRQPMAPGRGRLTLPPTIIPRLLSEGWMNLLSGIQGAGRRLTH